MTTNRERFEEHYLELFPHLTKEVFVWTADNIYDDSMIQHAWTVWQGQAELLAMKDLDIQRFRFTALLVLFSIARFAQRDMLPKDFIELLEREQEVAKPSFYQDETVEAWTVKVFNTPISTEDLDNYVDDLLEQKAELVYFNTVNGEEVVVPRLVQDAPASDEVEPVHSEPLFIRRLRKTAKQW